MNHPQLDGDEGDMVLGRMEARFRVLYHLACVTLESDYANEIKEALAQGIEALYDDWTQFRQDLVAAARNSAERGFIQSQAGMYLLEDQVGPSWSEADPGIPERWLAGGVR